MRASDPLRDEHQALLPELGALRVAADAVGTPAIAEQLDRARRLLDRHLLPHMSAEEAALYPTIDTIAGTNATAALHQIEHDLFRADLPAEGRER